MKEQQQKVKPVEMPKYGGDEAKTTSVPKESAGVQQKVSIGRIVLFTMATKPTKTQIEKTNEYGRKFMEEIQAANPARNYAATVTGVNEDGSVNLCVFDDTGKAMRWPEKVKFSDKPYASGCWSWPPRV